MPSSEMKQDAEQGMRYVTFGTLKNMRNKWQPERRTKSDRDVSKIPLYILFCILILEQCNFIC